MSIHLLVFLLPIAANHLIMAMAMTFDRSLMRCTIMHHWHSAYCKSLVSPPKFSIFGSRCYSKLKKVEPVLILKGTCVYLICFILTCLKLEGCTYIYLCFAREHDKKVCFLGLTSLLPLPADQLPGEALERVFKSTLDLLVAYKDQVAGSSYIFFC